MSEEMEVKSFAAMYPTTLQRMTATEETLIALLEKHPDRRLQLALQGIQAGIHWFQSEPWRPKGDEEQPATTNTVDHSGPELA